MESRMRFVHPPTSLFLPLHFLLVQLSTLRPLLSIYWPPTYGSCFLATYLKFCPVFDPYLTASDLSPRLLPISQLRLVNSSMFECNTSMCSVSPLLYTSSSGEEEEEEGSSLSSPLPSWGIALIVIASALVAAATVALVFIRRRRMSAQTEGGQRQTERVSPYEVEPSSPTIDMRI
mmetsp:Transcript_18085/g.45187  ORF Transcript_18085/g.45187 Transcript_18085/m.45187 type:complete len:176 (-) Transcript_18085:244-771(-)